MLDNTPNIQLKKADKIMMAVIAAAIVAAIAIPVLTWFATVTALLATVLENTIYSMLMLGGIIFSVMWLHENRTSLIYKWKNSARNLRRAVARENPIGVMDTALARFQKKLDDIGDHLVKAKGAKKQQDESIQKLMQKAKEADSLAVAAQRANKTEREIAVHVMQADRCRTSAEKVQPMADKFADVCEKLTQARDVCITQLENMKNQREIFKLEYDTLMSGAKAIKGFKAFFGANPDLEMLQLSIEQIDEQTAQAEAEIDQFLHDIQPQIDRQNLVQEAAQQAAMDRIRGTVAPPAPTAQTRQLTSASPILNLPSTGAGSDRIGSVKDGVVVPSQRELAGR